MSYLLDLMQPVGPVHARPMFGGYGLYRDDLMFGLVSNDTLYLKADAETVADFKGLGLEAFSYRRRGRLCSLSYYRAPEGALESSEEMGVWVRKGYGAALRSAAEQRKSRRPRPAGGKKRCS